MTTELTKQQTAERVRNADKVHRAEAKVYVVEGRTATYVTTVLCINSKGTAPDGFTPSTHGMPYTATCTCQHGRMQEHTTDARTGCRHVRWALAQAYEDYTTERDAR